MCKNRNSCFCLKITGNTGIPVTTVRKKAGITSFHFHFHLGQEKDVVERSASNARRREVEIAGGRVFVTTCGARNMA